MIKMKINKELATQMYNVLDEERQVSKLAFSLNDFLDWCFTVNHIGELNYRSKSIGDYLLSDYEMPAAMKAMAMPRKVSLVSGDEYIDLKDEEVYSKVKNIEGAKLLDAPKFSSISKGIVNSMRKSNATMVGMDSATAAQLLSTVQDRVTANKTHCLRDSKLYVPIVLQFNPVSDDFLGTKNEVMFKLWFKAACDEISRG
jgi:hypothetical protein